MTREEAFKHLRNDWFMSLGGQLCVDEDKKDAFLEAVGMGIKALRPVSREQVEKVRGEWQVCFEDWRKQIAGDQCSKCGFQHYGTSINLYKFCPHCGAPMTDEAVDILLGRLEALHEDNGCS